VISYHRIVKDLIDSRRVRVAIKEICAGRGEMQYAKTFITLFITGNQKGDLIKIFENSDTSLGVLMERINGYLSMLSFTREKRRDVFSIIITAILIFLTEFSILTTLFAWQASFFFWSLFPALFVMAFGLTLLATNQNDTIGFIYSRFIGISLFISAIDYPITSHGGYFIFGLYLRLSSKKAKAEGDEGDPIFCNLLLKEKGERGKGKRERGKGKGERGNYDS